VETRGGLFAGPELGTWNWSEKASHFSNMNMMASNYMMRYTGSVMEVDEKGRSI